METDPITFFHVIEAIAREDASTAWCVSQAGGCAMSAAYLDPPVANEIFGSDPHAVLAWGPGPKAKAVETEGGYKVTGVWAFACGSRHATWLGAHCPIFQADGSRLLGPNGKQIERTMLVPSRTWCGPTSGTPSACAARRATSSPSPIISCGPTIRSPANSRRNAASPGRCTRCRRWTCYQVGFSGVALGIARGALDSFIDVARNKVPRGHKSALRDNAVVQSNVAQAEAGVRSARAFLLQTVAEIWKSSRRRRQAHRGPSHRHPHGLDQCHSQGARGRRLRL